MVIAADPSSAAVATNPIRSGSKPISLKYAGRIIAAKPSPNPRTARAEYKYPTAVLCFMSMLL